MATIKNAVEQFTQDAARTAAIIDNMGSVRRIFDANFAQEIDAALQNFRAEMNAAEKLHSGLFKIVEQNIRLNVAISARLEREINEKAEMMRRIERLEEQLRRGVPTVFS